MQAKALKYHNAEAQWAMQAASNFRGTEAPDFTATAVFDEEFVDVKLSDYRGNKYRWSLGDSSSLGGRLEEGDF